MVLPTVLSIYVIPNTKDPMGGWLPSPSRDLWKILCEKRVNKIYSSEKKKKKKNPSYTLRLLRYSPDKIFKLKVTTARSKLKSRSDHDVAHLHILTNVPTKYQLPTPYGF